MSRSLDRMRKDIEKMKAKTETRSTAVEDLKALESTLKLAAKLVDQTVRKLSK